MTILIFDAQNIFTRHYLANGALSDLGHQVGGIIGFLSSIKNLSETLLPSQIIVCWEGSGGATKKRNLYPEYKQHRKPPKLNRFYKDDIPDTKENKNWQISSLIEILKYLPICQVCVSD